MKLPSNARQRPLHRHRRMRIGFALALSSVAIGAEGAGLGRLNVLSSIGQPLRAEIELTAVGRDEASTLTARLASPDAFGQANIDYGAALTGLRFSIQRRPDGAPYVLMTSSAQLNEPFLDVLVELTWGAGRLVREYTLLIDPPETRAAQRTADAAPIVQAQSSVPPPTRTPRMPRSTAGGSGSGGFGGPSSRASTAPAGSGAEYVVRSGDTAMSIARDNRPEGVSLEQVLAALYRDNPQAFSGNINRLLAGATVRLPDGATAQSLDAAEARRIVGQSANFGAYRDRIARNAPEAASSRSSGRQASGRLSTQVDDRGAAPSDTTDRLQLSRPDATRAGPAPSGPRSGIGAPGDELAAKDRELQETRSRLAMLEKNVADLTRLLELKNQSLAGVQGGAAAAGAAPGAGTTAPASASAPGASGASAPAAVSGAPTTSITPPITPSTAPSSTDAPATPPSAATSAAPAAPPPGPVAVPPVAKTAPMVPAREESFFDTIRDNGLLMAALAAVLALLVGYGLFTVARRRKLARFEDSIFVDNSVLHANSVFGTTGGQSVDTANSGFHSNFVPVAGTLPEHNEVDPVAEADVYIAYGRDAQAEEILKEALRADGARPAVRLKLLEIYAKRGDAKSFETMASELYASTGGQGDDWAHAAAMGTTLDPRNPLYAEAAAAPPAAPAAAPTPTPATTSTGMPRADTATVPTVGGASATNLGVGTSIIGSGLSGFGLTDLNLPEPSTSSLQAPTTTTGAGSAAAPAAHTRTEPMLRTAQPAPAPSMDLDFDLGFGNGAAPLSGTPNAAPPAPPAGPAAPPAPRGGGLDSEVGQSGKPMIDPFTASAFGGGDATARTAVNLPAFRARADQEPPAPPAPGSASPAPAGSDGFSASDIFGSSIIGDTRPMFTSTRPMAPPAPSAPQPFGDAVDSLQFEKTEPFDAFGGVNLDLDRDAAAPGEAAPNGGPPSDVWQAMATKLDLALAYSDIGDKDGARELLEEVVRNGDQTQASRARQLIGELG